MYHVATTPEPEKVVEVAEGNLLWKMGKALKPKNEHRARFPHLTFLYVISNVPQDYEHVTRLNLFACCCTIRKIWGQRTMSFHGGWRTMTQAVP